MAMSDHDVARLWGAIRDYKDACKNGFGIADAMGHLDTLINRFAKRQPAGDDKALAYLKKAREGADRTVSIAAMLKSVYGLVAKDTVLYVPI